MGRYSIGMPWRICSKFINGNFVRTKKNDSDCIAVKNDFFGNARQNI